MKGRKPKPTALKELEGNPGKRPLPENELKPESSVPECPAHIIGPAREEWDRITGELHSLKVLTRIDRAALAAYCMEWGRWVIAEEQVQRWGLMCLSPAKETLLKTLETNGLLFSDGERKKIKADIQNVSPAAMVWNPYLAIAERAMERMVKIAAEFGMTPSSRTRIHAEPPKEDNPLDAFLEGAQEEDREYQQ